MTVPPESTETRPDDPTRTLPVLDPVELRILGCLIEKQVTTPDGYPLSLNALVIACNQTTNRDPITHYGEAIVMGALDRLRQKGFVWSVTGSRVAKYEHRFREKLGLSAAQTAALCVLMLRGPQTAGEIRGRTGRLHPFGDLAEVDATLEGLRTAEPPLVTRLPRAPGTKESRFAHLLGGEVAAASDTEGSEAPTAIASASDSSSERIDRLEAELAALGSELHELRSAIAELRRRVEP